MSYSSFDSLDELAAALPFHLDDASAVNAAYFRWRATSDPRERSVVHLWTYCYIRRYFLMKFVQGGTWTAVDLDVLIDTAFRKTEAGESQVREPSSYASWVSVVCKNTFRNHLRARRNQMAFDGAPSRAFVAESPITYPESGPQQRMLARAIDQLPPHLRSCVRLRFLGGLSYAEIAQCTGRPLPTIRAFVYKAVKRLREDEEFLQNLE